MARTIRSASAKQKAEQTPRRTARERGYTREWEKAAEAFVIANPLCRACLQNGITNPSKAPGEGRHHVDHIIPHNGDQELFWDETNWQTLCKECHGAKRARENEYGKTWAKKDPNRFGQASRHLP